MDVRDLSQDNVPLDKSDNRRWCEYAVLMGLGLLVFGTNLGATRLWDVDEAIFSQAAVEMMQRGDLVTPFYNGQLFTHKPPFMYWCQIAAFHIFGRTEFAARFFSAIFGIGTLLVTYELGRLLFNSRTGLWAGLVLGSCINFAVIARAATPDAYLTFFCTLAMLVLVRGTRSRSVLCRSTGNAADAGRPSPEPFDNHPLVPWQPELPPSWLAYGIAYGLMAVATLIKGPVGIVIPMAVWGMFLLIEQLAAERSKRQLEPVEPRRESPLATTHFQNVVQSLCWFLRLFWPPYFLLTVWRMRPITALAVLLLMAGPWYLAVGLRTDGDFLREFFLVHNFGRAALPMESHRGPFFYYLIAICIGTFPWCVLIWPAMVHTARAIRAGDPARAGYLLITCWTCVWIGAFSLVATKLANYVIPAYPAIALGCAAAVDAWLRRDASLPYLAPLRRAWVSIALVGLGILIAVPILTRILFDGEISPALIGLVPLVGATIGWRYSEAGNIEHAVTALAITGVVFCVGLLGFAVLPVDAHKTTHLFAAEIQRNSIGNAHVATYKYSPPSLLFYSQIPFERLRSRDAVAVYFRDHPKHAFLVTTERAFGELTGYLPADMAVVRKERLFLKQENVVLLTRKTRMLH